MNFSKPHPRRKTIMLCVAGAVILLAVAGFVSLALLPEPTIEFVEFRGEGRDAAVIFRITNSSWVPCSFYGYDFAPPSPPNSSPPRALGAYQSQTASGTKYDLISPCRGIGTCHTVAGRSSVDVQVLMSEISGKAPVSLGILFYRGTATQITSAGYQKFRQWWYSTREFLKVPQPGYTWSNASSAP